MWLKLEKCLPGQRDGSARWFHDFQDILMNKCHVQPLPEMPSLFRMPPDVASTNAGGDGFDLFEPPSVASGGGLMHVDDLLATAHVDTLKDMVEVLSSKYKINAQWVCQVGDSLTFLKRRHKLISETELEIQVPGRHIEKLMELCGLKSSKNRPRKTPLPSGRLPADDENDPELDVARASTFRSATGILLYLQSDCIASQFGIRFLAGYMSRPTEGSWRILRHLVGYLSQHEHHTLVIETPVVGCGIKVQKQLHLLECFTDADWSGCKRTRKSVSGCVVMLNGQLLHASSRTQKVVSLSSAESEYHSAIGGCIDAIMLHRAVSFLFGRTEPIQLLIDNSAARAICQRAGVGRVRHLDGKLLWLQAKVAEGKVCVVPVETIKNVSDLGTKGLNPHRIDYLLGLIGVRDSTWGYERLGRGHEETLENAKAVRAVCKDLRGIAKGGKAEARMLSVMLLALQMAGSHGHERENEAIPDDQESFGTWLMTCILQVMSFACELCDRYPHAMIAIGQVTVLVMGMMLASICFRGRSEPAQSSVHVQMGGGVQVDVRLSNDKFAKPLRDPASRGAPARPMDISSSDLEVESTERVTAVRAQARGARSKAKSSPRARGRDNEPGVGSTDPMPNAPAPPPEEPPPSLPSVREMRRRAEEVWVATFQGHRYHRNRCSKLNNSVNVQSMTRERAEQRGYTPCGVCRP